MPNLKQACDYLSSSGKWSNLEQLKKTNFFMVKKSFNSEFSHIQGLIHEMKNLIILGSLEMCIVPQQLFIIC